MAILQAIKQLRAAFGMFLCFHRLWVLLPSQIHFTCSLPQQLIWNSNYFVLHHLSEELVLQIIQVLQKLIREPQQIFVNVICQWIRIAIVLLTIYYYQHCFVVQSHKLILKIIRLTCLKELFQVLEVRLINLYVLNDVLQIDVFIPVANQQQHHLYLIQLWEPLPFAQY